MNNAEMLVFKISPVGKDNFGQEIGCVQRTGL